MQWSTQHCHFTIAGGRTSVPTEYDTGCATQAVWTHGEGRDLVPLKGFDIPECPAHRAVNKRTAPSGARICTIQSGMNSLRHTKYAPCEILSSMFERQGEKRASLLQFPDDVQCRATGVTASHTLPYGRCGSVAGLHHTTRGWFSLNLHALHRLSGALPPHADAFAFIACRVAASGTDLAPSHRTYAFFFVGRHESFRLSLLHRPGILQTVIEAAKGHSPREELPFPTVQRKTGQSRAKRGLTVTHFLTQTTTLHHKQYVWSCTVGGKRNTSAHSGGDVGSYATLRNVGNYFPQSLWPHT